MMRRYRYWGAGLLICAIAVCGCGRQKLEKTQAKAVRCFVEFRDETGNEGALIEAIAGEMVDKTFYLAEDGTTLPLTPDKVDIWEPGEQTAVQRFEALTGTSPPLPGEQLTRMTLHLDPDGLSIQARIEVFNYQGEWKRVIDAGDFRMPPETSLERRTKLLCGTLLSLSFPR